VIAGGGAAARDGDRAEAGGGEVQAEAVVLDAVGVTTTSNPEGSYR
jgi:hypothetical protein